jgi:hypothetical protein
MNPRIKELVERTVGSTVGTPKLHNSDFALLGNDQIEKFAKLIITECATIALREEHDPYECILSHFEVDTIDGQLRKRSTYFGNNP